MSFGCFLEGENNHYENKWVRIFNFFFILRKFNMLSTEVYKSISLQTQLEMYIALTKNLLASKICK